MNMLYSNKNYQSDDPAWYFLAEYSLSDFMPDQDEKDELTAGLQFQTIREMGISIDFIDSIVLTLRSYAKEALANLKHARLERPEHVRIFCHKKMIEGASCAITSRFHIKEQTTRYESMIHGSETNMKGGWGYFLIERRGNYPTSSGSNSCNSVDLYLYNEGQ